MSRAVGDRLRVLCILPRMRDSRIARRIDMLLEAGFEVEAIAFEREDDVGREPACEVRSLGGIRHGRYIARIPKLLIAIPPVRSAMGRADLVYAFGPDLALLAMTAGTGLRIPVVLETADIREIQTSDGWDGRVVRALERLVAENCELLVLTSKCYRTYYRDWVGADGETLILENKVDAGFAGQIVKRRPRSSVVPMGDGTLRIGWFGMLRDEWSWRVLTRLLADRPVRFTAVLAGAGMLDSFHRRLLEHPGLEYLGEYANPGDLARIYGGVDMVMACYPVGIPGSWSRSNRYYEACLFGKPLIVRAGSADAERVSRHDIGLVIDTADIYEAVAAIRAVTPEDVLRWRKNLRGLPVDEYVITGEAAHLGGSIRRAAEGSRRQAEQR